MHCGPHFRYLEFLSDLRHTTIYIFAEKTRNIPTTEVDVTGISSIENAENKICIIGNGSSLLKYEYGPLIDTFGTVGRINNFSTAGYERHTGTKWDIWFNGANQKLRKRTVHPDRTIVIIPPDILKRKGTAIHSRIRRRLSAPSYELVPAQFWQDLERQYGIHRFTTGTAALLWAIEIYGEVYIAGFDFFLESKTHYNESAFMRFLIQRGIIKKGKKHNLTGEKSLIERLHRNGRIHYLRTYL
ncbi:MAG: glycosyltransferase family 29 protein [Fibrobacterota bacterium]